MLEKDRLLYKDNDPYHRVISIKTKFHTFIFSKQTRVSVKMGSVNLIRKCNEFIQTTTSNLNREKAWFTEEKIVTGKNLVEDLDISYKLENWLLLCLDQTQNFIKLNAQNKSEELPNRLKNLSSVLMDFKEKLLLKREKTKQTIMFLIDEAMYSDGINEPDDLMDIEEIMK